ncbi:hypothetical protein ACTA71_000844 [Dictyostelium dimigraforme]
MIQKQRIDYYLRTNKIVTDFKKVDQLINNVFYQRESCSSYRIAVDNIINKIESEEGDWRTVITKTDDNLTPEINKEFTRKVSVAIQEGQYENRNIYTIG